MGLVETVVEKVKDVLNQGPQNWFERLGGEISLTSPDGDSYSPKWVGDPRSISKKLAVFRFPKVRGNVVQDLEVDSDRYTLTLYFEGKDNDLDANKFFTSCRQKGTWEVIHPIHGFVELQLVSATENNEPVKSGNITVIDTEWIEPIDPVQLKTARELAGLLDKAVDDLNVSAAQQFADKVSQASKDLVKAVENTSRAVNTLTTTATQPLFTTLDAVNNAITGVQSGINSTLTQTTIILDSLCGQTQQLTQLPTLGAAGSQEKMAVYSDLLSDQLGVLPSSVNLSKSQRFKNEIATVEMASLASIGAIGKLVTLADLDTRAQALDLAQSVLDAFDALNSGLDAAQEQFEDFPIDRQYFSNSGAYSNVLDVISLSLQYLLALAPDLKVERRFTLDRPRSPIEITITEYGSLGENDFNFNLFIASNALEGKEIFILDRGTEIVIYA